MNFDAILDSSATVFSSSYLEARQKFLSGPGQAQSYTCSSKGPAGELLSTDVAYFGPPTAQNLLVLVSGTHGVEGYCGSAAQLLFLRAGLHQRLPAATGVLFVHALNCYGFAWDRRVTAEGCDLNRNFVDFAMQLPDSAGYEELAEHLVPEDRSESGMQRAEAAIAAYRARHGELKFQQARKAGQYTCPGGMFFGGTGPTEARRTLEQIASDFRVGDRAHVVVIDYHTGLGPYGYGELQTEQPSGTGGYQRAVGIFGSSVTSPDLGTSSSVAIHGCQDEHWHRALGNRHTYVALEFGTYDPEQGRAVLRDDHWLFKYQPKEVSNQLGRDIRNSTKRHYYPTASDWREMVLWRSHQVHRQAINALGSDQWQAISTGES